MAYVLSAQRKADLHGYWKRYERYLTRHKDTFPPSAFELANAGWYYNFNNHRCPHDAWLESFELIEVAMGERQHIRYPSLTIKLLGAYHDGIIEYHYPKVFSYQCHREYSEQGHGDWLYDEFRVNEDGSITHEIEWAGHHADTGPPHWIIRADDVHYSWHPFSDAEE